MRNKKCIVMFSGGLDSRLALKLMQEQGFEIVALFFKLPFGTGCCNENCAFNFSQMQGVKLEIFDCTRGKLLKEYLRVMDKATHGTGAGVNACIDCRIFMLKKAKKFADENKIDLIVTGEVLGERPMSQMRKKMDLIEEKSGLTGRLLRPLSAKLFSETDAEKKGIVNREKLFDINGRRRERQIQLAKKFKIKFPHPAGGCLLCEKRLRKRLKFLLDRGMNCDEINLVGVGRHFIIDGCWIVLGRNEKENKLVEFIGKNYSLFVPKFIGPSAVVFDMLVSSRPTRDLAHLSLTLPPKGKFFYSRNRSPSLKKSQPALPKGEGIINKIGKLMLAYSKKGSLKERKEFEEFKV